MHVEVQEGRSCLLLIINHPVPVIIVCSHSFRATRFLETSVSLLHHHAVSVFVWGHCFTFVNMNLECFVVTFILCWIAHLPHRHAGVLIDLHICLPPVPLQMNCMLAYSFVIFIAILNKPCSKCRRVEFIYCCQAVE